MKTENILNQLPLDGLKTNKLVSNQSGNIILIAIEKGNELKEHTSNTDASILILQGKVIFKINGEEHIMQSHDLFSFKKNETHAIEALTNSKLILIK
ncbi:MAG: cupin domain-containing protein [Flavobacteriales bacterium]|nr:cupin domain-containing protein [Flavobacteriales bacterium]